MGKYLSIVALSIVLFVLLPSLIFADTGLELSNDVLWPGHSDRWYTHGTRVFHAPWALGMEMYTPRDKRNPGIPYGDRPWDGYAYLERSFKLPEQREVALRVGCVGACSQQDKLQKFVHNDLGLGVNPKGWGTQNPSEPTMEVLYGHGFPHVFDSWIGTVRAETKYGFRAGNVEDSGFLQAEVRRGYLRPSWSAYGVGGVRGEVRIFNTHIQGRLLHDDTYTVDAIPFVASTWLGAGVSYGAWNLEVAYTYVTDETELQNYERHLFGTVEIKRIWN